MDLAHPAWFFPQAGWLSPPALCQSLVQHASIQVIYNTDVISLDQQPEGWSLHDAQANSIANCDAVIIANSHDALSFSQTRELPVKTIRGQITQLASPQLSPLNTVLCHEGYVTPPSMAHTVWAPLSILAIAIPNFAAWITSAIWAV
nr:FAD-dependent oxidoreductase [Oceanicoccus sp. KOV_DT_Chl]